MVSSAVLKWRNLRSPTVKNELRKKTGIRKRKSKDKSPSPGMLTQTPAELCEVCTAFISCSSCKWCLLVSSVQVIKTHTTGVQLWFSGCSHVCHLYTNIFLIPLLVIILSFLFPPRKWQLLSIHASVIIN